ncbi:MAG: alpha/beta fold hydrolase [Acidobacteria bacterium]|nr:alpha/beta fold hydrolase [Acidobacteriota bacterium]MBI3656250.1 alpha/beta fold hydrolase [Acidobacteriota bacterium]
MKPIKSILFLSLLWPLALLAGGDESRRLTAELINKEGLLTAPAISGVNWHPQGRGVTYVRQKGSGKDAVSSLWNYEVSTGKEKLLLDSSTAGEKLSVSSYQWSPKSDALLLRGAGDLWIVDVLSGVQRRLTKDPEDEEEPTFSPDGERIAYIKKNDLYALELKTGLVEKLTGDGGPHIMNGKLDWVYEEELTNRRRRRSYQWSPDSKKIIFLRLDENRVPEYVLTDYLSVHPPLIKQRYPKAGDPNSIPSVHMVTVGEPLTKTWTVALKDSVEYVAPEFSWTADSKAACFLTLNRDQTELTVHLWDPIAGKDQELLSEKDPFWINSLEPPRFLKDGQHLLWLSERTGFLHVYLYKLDGELVRAVTEGNWLIDQSPEVDEKGGWLYFNATEKDPRERHLYRRRITGGDLERLSKEPGIHSLKLSSDGAHLISTFSAINAPPQVRLLQSNGVWMATLDQPENRWSDYRLATTEFHEITATDGARLFGRLVKPSDFNPQKKYPVIVFVYGGPHSQLIQKRWGVTSLTDHLLAQEGFLIWSLDNRGSWGRGHKWESAIFKDLGRHELADQLDGVAYLKSLPYVDASRLGLWGWSYGGYLTLYALTKAPDVFKCGVAGAPVTDWKFYDTIYTERYMKIPRENPEGYKNSSPLEAAAQLKAKLLILHGTADDNVHMQNTMSFLNALVKAARPYELQIQPGQKHGFHGEAARTYLTASLLEFFKKHL